MIQRDPSHPHDSRHETLDTHYAEEASASHLASPFAPFAKAMLEGHRAATQKDGNSVAVWLGYQPGHASIPGFHLFNTTKPILKAGEVLPVGATVTAATLNAAGYSTPTIPPTAATPAQKAADQHHDEKTEGYARRPFRTNFKE